jgi:hypothetical protein
VDAVRIDVPRRTPMRVHLRSADDKSNLYKELT